MRRVTAYEWREGAFHICRSPRGGLVCYHGGSLVSVAAADGMKIVTKYPEPKAAPYLEKYCPGFVPTSYADLLKAVKVESAGFWALQLHYKRRPGKLAEAFPDIFVGIADSYASGNCYRGSMRWIRERYGAAGGASVERMIADMQGDYRAFDACCWAVAVHLSKQAGEWPEW